MIGPFLNQKKGVFENVGGSDRLESAKDGV